MGYDKLKDREQGIHILSAEELDQIKDLDESLYEAQKLERLARKAVEIYNAKRVLYNNMKENCCEQAETAESRGKTLTIREDDKGNTIVAEKEDKCYCPRCDPNHPVATLFNHFRQMVEGEDNGTD